jgi:monofunctional biosynthetic peptidoglycan transglycosylase
MDEGKRLFEMILKTARLAIYSLLGLGALFLLVGLYFYSYIPSRKEIRGCMTTKMFQVNLCPGSPSYVPLVKISQNLQKAVVLTEDSAFWDHSGFDLKELQRSFEKNMAKGSFVRGGSTITQQLAKNLFLTPEKTLQRKALEALITLQIEKNLSKKEILERYLNVVQFGRNMYGVKEAAKYYFKKDPSQLSVVESAFLAFLLPSPEKYSVSFFKKKLTPFARKRLNDIINNLYRYSRIDEEQYQVAKQQVDYFIQGSAYQAAPTGLDLNAPEEDFWIVEESEAQSPEHSINRESGQGHRNQKDDAQLKEDERVFEGAEAPQDQSPANIDDMGQGQKVEETF